MSRHRLIRNLDLDEEMAEDDPYDPEPEPEPELSESDNAQLQSACQAVRDILGPEEDSGIGDGEIADAVWEFWFDVEKSVGWLLEQRDKRLEKQKKAAQPKPTPKKPTPTSQPTHKPPASTTKKKPPTTTKPTSATTASSDAPALRPTQAGHTQLDDDLAGLNISQDPEDAQKAEDAVAEVEVPKPSLAKEKLLEEVGRRLESAVRGLNLVIIGHVDAGKSTLMGRLLYELGELDEKARRGNERESERAGKASFRWAWALDESAEERERGVTMDIATTHIRTPSLLITLLDAPGHADFVPNMISGAAQADAALLVVDASPNSFEAGFERAGQTREHLVLVRALGVSQVVVAVNKIDLAIDAEARYNEILTQLTPFLLQTGFQSSRITFVPLSGIEGINLTSPSPAQLPWYSGPTLLSALDSLQPPARPYTLPLRIPLSNVFRGQTALASGIGVTGRVVSGVVQVGEKLRILPGDESAVVRLIEQDDESVPWAAAGSTVTLYLAGVDQVHLEIGSVLCPPDALVPLTTTFTAQIITFDLSLPLTPGMPVELFHHSRNVPCTLSKLLATLDRTTGTVLKSNPRVLTKGQSARVQVSLRTGTISGPGERVAPVPMETFGVNKDMGRVLLRRGGETVAAGIVLELLG